MQPISLMTHIFEKCFINILKDVWKSRKGIIIALKRFGDKLKSMKYIKQNFPWIIIKKSVWAECKLFTEVLNLKDLPYLPSMLLLKSWVILFAILENTYGGTKSE